MEKLSRRIVKARVPILILSLLLLLPAGFGYLHTRVNYDILDYLPDDIETMQGQDILLRDFGKGAYALFVADGLNEAQEVRLQEKLEQVEHVEQVLSFNTLAGSSIPQDILPDKIYDFFHSETGTLMAIFFDTSTSADETMEAIKELRAVAGEQCFLSSMSAIVTDTKQLVDDELFWYVLIAVVLSALVLALTMDSWMAPVLFLVTVGMAVIYNLGTNMLKGEISFVTQALAAVLQLAVTMDYSIFLWNAYREQLKETAGKEEAMAKAISATIVSVAGSSLTTVAGFIALCFMTFTLGMDLGVVMAKGVLLGVLCCVTVLPAFILLFDKAIQKTGHRPLTVNGEKAAGFILKHRKVLMALLLLLWIPAIIGYNQIQVYYKLDESLPDELPCIQANKILEEDFDTSTVHLVLVNEEMPVKDAKAMLDRMEQVDGVKAALGIDSLVGSAIPKDFLPEQLTEDLTAGGRQLILITSEYPVASDEVNAQVDELEAILKQYAPDGMLIGEAPCTRDLITITDRDFQVVSAVSIGAIFLLIFFVLRSVSLPVILVLVIELAIYINLAISGFDGAVLPFIASIVVGTVQLGATVDYAILLTNRYQTERRLGKDKEEAAHTALSTSIPSVLTSALGFFAATIGVGLYSDVDMIGTLCLLLGRGALISMALVLCLLPALLIACDGLIAKTSWGRRSRKKNMEGLS